MAVEFISSPIPKICDQAGAQTYNPDSEVRLKNRRNTDMRSFTGQLHNDCMSFTSLNIVYILYILHQFWF